jgi:uncharacterized repeat protein (TIGR03803 family)
MVSVTGRYALSFCVAAALVAGCGGSQPPIGVPGAMPRSAAIQPPHGEDSPKYQVLFDFGSGAGSQTNGGFPWVGLIVVNGALYGTTVGGGAFLDGTIFSITTTGSERVLYSFGYDGEQPWAGLLDEGDTLYGTTLVPDGNVFSVHTTGKNFRVLYTFDGDSSGSGPMASLIKLDGRLYGTTTAGGAYGDGTVFSLGMTTHKERVLYSFGKGSDGQDPEAPLIDVNGTFYGTTNSGGVQSVGTVFSVSTTGKETVLHSFGGDSDGSHPTAGLIDVNGTLYGTTTEGGAYGDGTVFSISTSGTESVLYSFGKGSDGQDPEAALISVNGTFYGTTNSGGVAGDGTVFSLRPSTRKEHVLHSFGEGTDGKNPASSMVDFNGTLYGTTPLGGSGAHGGCDYDNPCGTVFALKL